MLIWCTIFLTSPISSELFLFQKPGGTLILSPSPQQQQDALIVALTELLWQAGSGASASVALPPPQERGSSIVHEQLMRGGMFLSVSSKNDLQVGQWISLHVPLSLTSFPHAPLLLHYPLGHGMYKSLEACRKCALLLSLPTPSSPCQPLSAVHSQGRTPLIYGRRGVGRRAAAGVADADPWCPRGESP